MAFSSSSSSDASSSDSEYSDAKVPACIRRQGEKQSAFQIRESLERAQFLQAHTDEKAAAKRTRHDARTRTQDNSNATDPAAESDGLLQQMTRDLRGVVATLRNVVGTLAGIQSDVTLIKEHLGLSARRQATAAPLLAALAPIARVKQSTKTEQVRVGTVDEAAVRAEADAVAKATTDC